MHKGFSLGLITTLVITFVSLWISVANATITGSRQTTLTQIKQLTNAHKIKEAYQLASEMARQEEGNVEFDLLLGSLAIDTKHPDVAIFALERVLMQQPSNQYAKQKLGNAYFLTGDYPSAKPLLTSVVASQAPKTLRNDAKKLLLQMKKPPENTAQAKFSNDASIELATGYDSNINSTTANNSISIPHAGDPIIIFLTGNNIKDSDSFADLRGNWQGYYPMPASQHAGLFWDINGTYRDNTHNSAFNLNTFNTTGGLMLQDGNYTLRVPMRAQIMYLNGNPLRRALTMAASLSRPINEQHAGMVFLEKGTQTYPTQNLLSAATNLAGAGWLYLPNNKTQAITRVYYGINESKLPSDTAKAQSSHYYGAEINLNRELFDKGMVSIDLGEQFATFNIVDPLFLVLRKDNFFNFGIKYEWKYNQELTILSDYNHFQNNSDLPLYHYKRNIVELGLKYSL